MQGQGRVKGWSQMRAKSIEQPSRAIRQAPGPLQGAITALTRHLDTEYLSGWGVDRGARSPARPGLDDMEGLTHHLGG